MAWLRELRRERRQGSCSVYDDILVATTIARIGTEEEENKPIPRRGSIVGRRTIARDRYSGYCRLVEDYFVSNSVYGENLFRRRFRMTKNMFEDIKDACEQANVYFKWRQNAAGVWGLAPVQKVTAALRMLAYGGPADSLDEYLRMGESTIIESVNQFTRTIVDLYGPRYLRQPTRDEIQILLQVAEARGFPGMLGSIDCMHWEWENCPTAWHGQYRGHFKKPTLILEAVASYDTWIWHAFFGLPGSLNDINVLHRSPVFDNLAAGNAPEVQFNVNGREYNMGYYLADGIYPPWATLINGIQQPSTNKHKEFASRQAEFRKDVERTFGILQGQYGIIKGPARLWDQVDLKYIVDCIVILHNMGIEYERGLPQLRATDYEGATDPRLGDDNTNVPELALLMENHRRIQSRQGNAQLKLDLIEHIWSKYGDRANN